MQEYNGPSNAYLFMHDSLNDNDTQPKNLTHLYIHVYDCNDTFNILKLVEY